MTDAERRIKAKIPGKETGIEIKHTFCSICEPIFHCFMDVYIKDGKIIKLEGNERCPVSRGKLCPKGLAGRQFVYRKDRLKTPLRRIGARGEGKFEEISWEEAYRITADHLNRIKEQSGPESVVFFSGYAKWYRSFLQRLAHSFGSPNFGTESSTCHMAAVMACEDLTGRFAVPDVNNAATYMAWAVNPFHSKPAQLKQLYQAKERGMKIVVIDPRITPTASKLADLYLPIRPGTDGALALGMGKIIIERGWTDDAYIEKHVHGFEEYAAYVERFDLQTVSEITGVSADKIEKAAEWYATRKPSCISQSGSSIVHHRNGYQNLKAILSLSAITGNYDVKGGNFPIGETFSHQWAGFETKEPEFTHGTSPQNGPLRIGYGAFPLWKHFISECQMTDFVRQVREQKPYKLRGLLAFGMNNRMFPQSHKILEAIDSLDFVMSTELFMTDVCRHSDIVLPVCTSFEREEFKVYPGGYAAYVKPVIEPLYDSRPDTTVIKELAEALKLDDPLLRSGYENCVRWMLSDCQLNLDECIESDLPVKVPDARPYEPEKYTETGYDTPTGKFELYSESVRRFAPELAPLPEYTPPYDEADEGEYPMILSVGARLPYALHSRMHEVPWTRSLRPDPMADISPEDAGILDIAQGDSIMIESPSGKIRVKANVSGKIQRGNIHMYHGYREADANELVNGTHVDPYTGFPGYNCVRCKIVKGDGR